jgi:hypothetical protein
VKSSISPEVNAKRVLDGVVLFVKMNVCFLGALIGLIPLPFS